MYEDAVLDKVSKDILVYRRDEQKEALDIPTGHFSCTDCGSVPLSAEGFYVTVAVFDDEWQDLPIFGFTYAPNDKFYRENKKGNMIYESMHSPGEFHNSLYLEREEVLGLEVWARIVYTNGVFETGVHQNRKFRIGDLLDWPAREDEDGNEWEQELRLSYVYYDLYGTYLTLRGVETMPLWSKQDKLRYVVAAKKRHPMLRKAAQPTWVPHKPSNNVKGETKIMGREPPRHTGRVTAIDNWIHEREPIPTAPTANPTIAFTTAEAGAYIAEQRLQEIEALVRATRDTRRDRQ